MAEARMSQIPEPQLAVLTPFWLTSCLMMLKVTKSQTMATKVTTNVISDTREAKKEPTVPVKMQRRQAMKHKPVATGCRTITRVRPLAVVAEASPKSVPSRRFIRLAGS